MRIQNNQQIAAHRNYFLEDCPLFQLQQTQSDDGQDSFKCSHLIVVPLAVFTKGINSPFGLDRLRFGLNVDLIIEPNFIESSNVHGEYVESRFDSSENVFSMGWTKEWYSAYIKNSLN